MAKARILLLLVLSLIAADASAADSHIKVVEFTADACEPCKRMQPVISKLSQEGWDVRPLDVGQAPQLVEHFRVKSVPTIIILRDGQEVDRVVGALGYEKLRARFERASGTAGQPASTADSLALIAPQPGRRSASEAARSATAAPATVRGQSPAITAFPLLSAGTFGSLAAATAEAAAPPSNTREMTEAPLAPLEPFSQQQQQQQQQQPAQPYHPQTSVAALTPSHATTGRSTSAPSAEAIAIAGAATVRIRIDEANAVSFGTGTIINVHGQQALVLTCGHLFRDMKADAKLTVDLFQAGRPMTLPASLVTFNAKEYDLGLIEFQLPMHVQAVQVAPLAEQPQVGDVAFSFGCDRGADPTRRDTQIKRINRYLGAANIEIHGAPVVGRSGGGLFDAQGRLVGVCNAADEEDNEGIYAALPIVHQQLASLNLQELRPQSASAALISTQSAPPANAAQWSSTTNAQSSSALGASSSGALSAATSLAATPGYWPDQNAATASIGSAVASSAPQVRCVIRDAAGQESAITIDHASDELVAMLRQHARR